MSTIVDLRPGDIGFGPIHGGAGLLVNAGQLLLGEGFHVGKLDIRHAFVVVDVGSQPSPDVYAVEAMPNGARQVLISNEHDRWTPEYAYVRLPEDYPGQGQDVAAIARAMIGTPYSFASYAALAAWHWGVKTPRLEAWIDRRQGTNRIILPSMRMTTALLPAEVICSVLGDQSWALTGKQVMPAGTPHQCVTPGALAGHLIEADGVHWLWPR